MKKLFITLAAGIVCMNAFSQEDENTVFDLSLEAYGRIDAVGEFPFDKEEKPGYNSGNSVLYTKLESNFAKYFNFTWVGHWLSTDGGLYPFYGTPASGGEDAFLPTKDLYVNSFHTDYNTWTDFLYLDFNCNGFNIRLGKDCLALGGFEYDKWDWEVDFATASTFWKSSCSYQWGGQIGYTTPSEMSSFVFQVQSSPLTWVGIEDDAEALPAYPWAKGIGSYSFKYTGEYGPFTTSNSYNFLQSTPLRKGEKTGGLHILAFGLSGNICDCANVGMEWIVKADNGCQAKDFFRQSQQADIFGDWELNDYLSLEAKLGYEKIGTENEIAGYELFPYQRIWGGITANVTPVQKFKGFHIAGTLAGQNIFQGNDLPSSACMSATLSLLIDFSIFNLSK